MSNKFLRAATLALALVSASGEALAQAATTLWFQRESGPRQLDAPANDFTFISSSPARVALRVTSPSNEQFTLTLTAPVGQTLLPGAYENTNADGTGGSPGLGWSTSSFNFCGTAAGRFTVLEATFDNNDVVRLAVNFEQRCESGLPTYGELRINSAWPLTAQKPPGSVSPDPFSFAERDWVAPGAEVLSSFTTIYGINAPAPIEVTGASYSLNGGPFTTVPGTAGNRDRLRLLATAASEPNTTRVATVTVGGRASTFRVSTYPSGVPVTAFRAESATPNWILGGAALVFAAPPEGSVTATHSASATVNVAIRDERSSYQLTLVSPSGPLAPGPYEMAARAPFRGQSPGLEFTGPGGCSTLSGRFVILEFTPAPNGAVATLAADFEQRCDGGAPVYGEVRINSALPFTFQKPAGSTTPDAFAFAPREHLQVLQVADSHPTTIYGINAPAPVQVTGGLYSVNGGPFTADPGTVVHRDRVVVRTTAPATAASTATATLSVGGVSASFQAKTHAPGTPLSALVVQSRPGDWITGGADVDAMAPDWQFRVTSQNGLEVWTEGPAGAYYRLGFAAPPGATLDVGAYEMAARLPFRGTSPGLEFSSSGRGCNTLTGRFAVLELERVDTAVTRLAVNFEQSCDGGPRVHGELRFNSAIPLLRHKPAGATLPDPFAFLPQGPVTAGAVAQSNATSIFGVNAPVPVSITGGEYSLNGAPFTSAPGFAGNKDRVVLRVTAATEAGGLRTAAFNAGGRSATFRVTTVAAGEPLTALAYRSPAGDYVGGGSTDVILAPPNAISTRGSGTVTSFSISTSNGGWWDLDFAAPDNTPLAPGMYPEADRYPFQRAGHPGLSFSGNGRGCNTVAGRFVVHEVAYHADGSLQRFAADFEHRCETSGPPLVGEIRYNSTVPLSAMAGGNCAGRDIDGDGMADCIEWEFSRNPFVKDNDIFADTRLFAMQQYRDFLGREGDDPGIDHWTGELDSGAQSPAQMVRTFFDSAEFQGTMAPVARLYFAYFLRIPDYGGVQYWTGRYRGGTTLEAISDAFAGSAEFVAMYGALDHAQFVDRVYRNVMGRAPDADGLAFWTSQLSSGARTRGQVMAAFSESAEYRALSAQEIFVTMTYVGMLRREPDAGGFAFWVGEMDGGRPDLSLIQGFLDSQEYRNRFLP